MIIDKLYDEVLKKSCVCLGLDTAIEYIPKNILENFSLEDAIFEFNKRIIDATYDVVGCFKPQIAYYEVHGLSGLSAYTRTIKYAKEKGSIVIADIKRGDIAKTAEMYARAHFEGDFESDFITLNPYMGLDSIEPYLPYVENKEKGLFILIRTSNEGAKDIQYIENKSEERVYDIVGDRVTKLGSKYMGASGYSSIGGVVGCTHVDEGVRLRNKLDRMFFLIPGYGAQGGGASEVAIYLKNGNGGVVNSSRKILLAYKEQVNGEKKFEEYAREEVLFMREEIKSAANIL